MGSGILSDMSGFPCYAWQLLPFLGDSAGDFKIPAIKLINIIRKTVDGLNLFFIDLTYCFLHIFKQQRDMFRYYKDFMDR